MTDSSVSVGGGVALTHPSAQTRPASRPRSRVLTSSRVAWLALLGLVGSGIGTVLCSGQTALVTPDSIRLDALAPNIFFGRFSAIGPNLHLGGVIALFTLMCACYLVLVRLGRELPARAIIAGVVLLELVTIFGPPLLSTDIFSYGAYGKMAAVYHFNPYVLSPLAIRGDRWYPFIGSLWVETPTVYGPVFTAMSYLLGHLSVSTAVLAYKLITVAGSLVAIAGVAKAAQRLGRDTMRVVLFVGLNPVLIMYAVGGAHNDMLMLAALTWAIAALVVHRARTSGGLLVLAVAVKLTGAIMIPFALAAHRGPARLGGHQRRLLAGGVLVLIGAGIMSTVLFGEGPLHVLGTLEVIQSNGGRQSIPGFIAWGLGLGRLSHTMTVGLQAVTVITVIGLIVAVRKQRIDWITATGWAIVVLLVTSTYLLPWYVVWVLPFAALSDSRSLRIAALALTAVGMTSL